MFALQAFLHEIEQSGFCVAICVMVDKDIQEKRNRTSIQGIVSWVHHEREGVSSARGRWWYLFLNCVHSFSFLLLLVSFSVSRSFVVLLFAWAAPRIACKSESMVWLTGSRSASHRSSVNHSFAFASCEGLVPCRTLDIFCTSQFTRQLRCIRLVFLSIVTKFVLSCNASFE